MMTARVWRFFRDRLERGRLRFVGIALPPTVFMSGALSATQGWKTMRYYSGIGLVIVPAWVKILNPRFLTERRRGVDRVPGRLAVG